MTLGTRVFLFGFVGIISGMISWPCAELILYFQSRFPTLLLFNSALGMSIGLFMGGSFGTTEGIIARSGIKIRSGMIMGIVVGIIGGLIGFIAGQAALHFIGTTFFNSSISFQRIGFPISRAAGWAVFGMFIGNVEGIRSRSGAKIRNGIIGGFIGGALGGMGAEYVRLLSPESFYARLVGLLILGFMIGIFYGFIEIRLTKASLLLMNGRYRGREFLLTQRLTRVGESEKTEIGLRGYRDVSPIHAQIKKERDGFVLMDAGSKKGIWINDQKQETKRLKDGDVIRIGNAKFRFTEKNPNVAKPHS